MTVNKIKINDIPAIVWGEKSDKVYLFVHGKMSSKESAEAFAEIAEEGAVGKQIAPSSAIPFSYKIALNFSVSSSITFLSIL